MIAAVGQELDQLVPEWTLLADTCGRSFYGRPSYSLSWWEQVGRGELAVFWVRRAGQLVALAPLHRRRLPGQQVLRLLGHGLGTIGEVLVKDGSAGHSLWDFVAQDGAALQLTHVRPNDAGVLALRRHSKWREHIEINDRCLTVQLPKGVSTRDLHSRRTVRKLARYRTDLERTNGPFRVEVIDDTVGLRSWWAAMVLVAERADANRGRLNLFAPPWVEFTRALLEREAAHGTLLIVGATAGGQWFAHQVALRHAAATALWVTRFDPAYAAYNPGHLIQEWLVDHHDEIGIEGIDSLLGEDSFKSSWTNTGYDVGTLTAATTGLALCRARLAIVGALVRAARHGATRMRHIDTETSWRLRASWRLGGGIAERAARANWGMRRACGRRGTGAPRVSSRTPFAGRVANEP